MSGADLDHGDLHLDFCLHCRKVHAEQVGVRADGAIYLTADGGQQWKASPLHCFTPTSVACPSSSRCEAVGFTSDGSHEFGEIQTSRDGARIGSSR